MGAEISLTAQSLFIGHCSFPFKSQGTEVSETQHLITAVQTGPMSPDREERRAELVGNLQCTVELAEVVTLLPLSVRLAQCRVIRLGDSAVVKVPRNEAVLIGPGGMPGIYIARISATLYVYDIKSSTNASGLDPPVVGKSPL